MKCEARQTSYRNACA